MSRVSAILDSSDPCSPLSVPASQTAFLLLDYQNITVSRLGTETAIRAAETRDWALKQGILVIHCLVSLDQAPPAHLKAASRIKGYVELLEKDPKLVDEWDGLAYQEIEDADEVTVSRLGGLVSALESAGIKEMLAAGGKREGGIKSLLLGGLSTSGCVLSTAKATADQQFITTVLSDLCADPVDGLHETLVQHVLPSNCHVCTFEELRGVWME